MRNTQFVWLVNHPWWVAAGFVCFFGLLLAFAAGTKGRR